VLLEGVTRGTLLLDGSLTGTATDTMNMAGLQEVAVSRDDSNQCISALLAMCAWWVCVHPILG